MKINLALFIDNSYKTQDLHEDFAGVTTYGKKRGGEFRVKNISAVAFNYDGTLTIYAHPLDRDVPAEPVVADALTPMPEAPAQDEAPPF